MVDDGTLLRLNQDAAPNCYLHRSNPQDVARTEHLTFICSERPEDAGPNNNWMRPAEPGSASGRSSTAHAGPHDVRRAVHDGPGRVALQPRWASRSPIARTSSPTCAS